MKLIDALHIAHLSDNDSACAALAREVRRQDAVIRQMEIIIDRKAVKGCVICGAELVDGHCLSPHRIPVPPFLPQ